MASTIPQPPPRATALASPPLMSPPPNGPLPALPIARSRRPQNSLPDIPDLSESRPSTAIPSSQSPTSPAKSHTRSVTASGLPTPKLLKASSTPAVPSVNAAAAAAGTADVDSPSHASSPAPVLSAIPTPGKSVRKTTSIGQFPLPPKTAPRVSSLPPSPLSTSASTADVNGAAKDKSKRDSGKHRNSDIGVKKSKTRSSGYGLRPRASNSSLYSVASPSFSNGTGESNLIASIESGLRSSTIASAVSSVNGSAHTDGTSFGEEDDRETADRGRRKSQDTITDKRLSQSNDGKDTKGNVLVSVRVRPDAGGGEAPTEGEWLVDGRRSLISYRGREGGEYRFDNVFSPHDQNARVYDHAAKRLVRRVMEGYHGTVFAYGMTGTGKTFSMQGTATSPGVIPLAISDIFSYIREKPTREFLLRVSYLEIYNEKIYDLLSPSAPGQPQQEEIKLRKDNKRGVYATPLKEEIVQSPNQLLRVIARGDLARRTGSTQFNARSSRSHAVVQIVVESRERTHAPVSDKDNGKLLPGGVLVSTLSLIDLAGSEKAADNKERRTEGAHINKSLLTLGTVIARLSGDDEKEDGGAKTDKDNVKEKEKATKHLPYRDSKLTRLLQPALSGNSLVSILCTIQLSSAGTSAATTGSHTGETLNTLKFASRAKNNIVSHAKRNESNATGSDAGSRALLDRYRFEIQELRAQREKHNNAKEAAEEKDAHDQDEQFERELERQEHVRHEEQMLEMQLARTALKERIGHLNRLILSSKSLGVNSSRFSSLSSSAGPQNRLSALSTTEFGCPVSVRSRDSLPSSGSPTRRESTATLDPVRSSARSDRVTSVSSLVTPVSAGATASSTLAGAEDDEGPHATTGGEGDDDLDGLGSGVGGLVSGLEGEASLAQQNRMLQADLADKTRYIATLEKRLLQARRTSHSRVSMQFAARAGQHPDDGGTERILFEKDREIDDLRAKLDDQTRMVNALRSAARKRELLDRRKSHNSESHGSEDTTRPVTAVPAANSVTNDTSTTPNEPSSRSTSTSFRSSSNRFTNSSYHISTMSNTSRSSVAGAPFSPPLTSRSSNPLSPIALLRSPSGSDHSDSGSGAFMPPPPRKSGLHHRKTSGDARASISTIASNRTSGGTSTATTAVNPSSTSSTITLAPRTSRASNRRRSVDEMTQLLDQMIQDKVESGHMLRTRGGDVRATNAREHHPLLNGSSSASMGSNGGGSGAGSALGSPVEGVAAGLPLLAAAVTVGAPPDMPLPPTPTGIIRSPVIGLGVVGEDG